MPSHKSSSPDRNILIVEDSLIQAKYLVEVFRRDGWYVETIFTEEDSNGHDYLIDELINTFDKIKHKAGEKKYTLMILDLQLPDSKGSLDKQVGFDVLEWLQDNQPSCTVVIASGQVTISEANKLGRSNILVIPHDEIFNDRQKLYETVIAYISVFDVFLSHNSKDKKTVIRLAKELQKRGLRVWLDKWELVPGQTWLDALEKIIETAKSAAVLVGKDGLGPWEKPEMQGCLLQFVERKLPVIPVLLPGAATKPELPLFLRTFMWVDLRNGLTKDSLDRLEWGITGKKP